MQMNNEKNRWTINNMFKKHVGVSFPPSYPNEMLVKLCSSKSYSNLTDNLFKNNIKVCGIGSFSGNNLRFFIEKGYKVHAVEINNDMLNSGKDNLIRLGYSISDISFTEGDNLNIPHNDSIFDLFVSINTIHYNFGEDTEKVLSEYCRVVKKGGVIVIETPAENHEVFKAARRIGSLDYIWKYGDFRDDQNFGFFDNKEHFYEVLKKYFTNIEMHYRHEKTQKTEFEWHIAVCKV